MGDMASSPKRPLDPCTFVGFQIHHILIKIHVASSGGFLSPGTDATARAVHSHHRPMAFELASCDHQPASMAASDT